MNRLHKDFLALNKVDWGLAHNARPSQASKSTFVAETRDVDGLAIRVNNAAQRI
jgi:hypothetical protein